MSFSRPFKVARVKRRLTASGKKWVMICDVDGVLTDGTFSYTESGKYTKTFGPHDADALKLIKSKIEILFISADKRGFGISQKRVQDMGFALELVSSQDRKEYVSTVQSNRRVVFIGDSFTDELALRKADVSFTPANAHLIAKKASNYTLKSKGGEGAVSEVCFLLNKYLKENSHS
jgi:3-deoxy-D-manno-octulosonate 8-phosphate phosphatase (KDO 8-P phosphatase)